MRKRMLRSVLVAAFSAVVAFGSLSGLSVEKGDAQADTVWSLQGDTVWSSPQTAVEAGNGDTPLVPDDTVWS